MEDTAIVDYLLTQGPFAALFVWLLLYVMRSNKEREDLLRRESIQREEKLKQESLEREEKLRQESAEREKRLHDTLDAFSAKYDLIIERLDDIDRRLAK